MAKGKSSLKTPKASNAPSQKVANIGGHAPLDRAGFFPFAQYTSIVGVHTTLLTFTALFLPRTTFLLEFTTPSTDEAFITSKDRPQHPFLEALTLSPISTLLCICLGVLVLQAWWGGWVRNWAIDYTLVGSNDEKRLNKALAQKQRVKVRTCVPGCEQYLP